MMWMVTISDSWRESLIYHVMVATLHATFVYVVQTNTRAKNNGFVMIDSAKEKPSSTKTYLIKFVTSSKENDEQFKSNLKIFYLSSRLHGAR